MPPISLSQEKKLLECKSCWPMHSKQDIAALRKDSQPWSVYGAKDFDEYLLVLKRMYRLQKGALYATAGLAGSKFLYDLYNYTKPKPQVMQGLEEMVRSSQSRRKRRKRRSSRRFRRSSRKRY